MPSYIIVIGLALIGHFVGLDDAHLLRFSPCSPIFGLYRLRQLLSRLDVSLSDVAHDLVDLVDFEILPLNRREKLLNSISQQFLNLLLQKRSDLLQQGVRLVLQVIIRLLHLPQILDQVHQLESLLALVSLKLHQPVDAVVEDLLGRVHNRILGDVLAVLLGHQLAV